jgi:hypothetical protein
MTILRRLFGLVGSTPSAAPITDDDQLNALVPGLSTLFENTVAHILRTAFAPRGDRTKAMEASEDVAMRTRRIWTSNIQLISKQTLNCFQYGEPQTQTFADWDSRAIVALSTLPYLREAAPEYLRQLCPLSETPYSALIADLVNQ